MAWRFNMAVAVTVVAMLVVLDVHLLMDQVLGSLASLLGSISLSDENILLLDESLDKLTSLWFSLLALLPSSPRGPLSLPTQKAYDVIVVGGGSSGSVVAARLSEEEDLSVLLLESGPRDSNLLLDVPLACGTLQRTKRDWQGETEQQEGHACRSISCTQDPTVKGKDGCCRWPMGKTLGGGSSINYMAYVRGNPEDFNEWERRGATGWNYTTALRYFKKAENNQNLRWSSYHGVHGPLFVSDPVERSPLTAAFVEGCAAAGLGENPDYNGKEQEGCAHLQSTTYRGRRWSVSRAYLRPAMRRRNLEVVVGATVLKVEIDCSGQQGGGKEKCQAKGVWFRGEDGKDVYVEGRKEILLAASAVHTPKLLMLSGVGEEEQLKKHGIEVKVSSPGVGKNLQDHFFYGLMFNVTSPVSYRRKDATSTWSFLSWLLAHRGPLTSPMLEAVSFSRTRPSLTLPDLQLHMIAAAGSRSDFLNFGFNEEMLRWYDISPLTHGLAMFPTLLHPGTTGSVSLRSADPLDPPRVDPKYLRHPDDMATLLEGIRLILRIVRTAEMREWTDGKLLYNQRDCQASSCGCPSEPLEETPDSFWECQIRAVGGTVYHPAGTARMGADGDPLAVLDPLLRVRGVRGLRVVDASSWPMVTSGNTNAPTIMVAERAADLIKEALRKGN
uniref:Glucose-methanol-choline oxidoreductase N-terminal domain-containing protein n=1 Tax=Guillardia theta TaxID=55529 RepID=A0A7S4KR98_GUITH|mmetsp:Transcript_29519/g.94637  ORF Transcript_29519/g.94637 Transcript_29519/m.94637 type:complete len:669 (+) Transcript_29519:1-2007(+)